MPTGVVAPALYAAPGTNARARLVELGSRLVGAQAWKVQSASIPTSGKLDVTPDGAFLDKVVGDPSLYSRLSSRVGGIENYFSCSRPSK